MEYCKDTLTLQMQITFIGYTSQHTSQNDGFYNYSEWHRRRQANIRQCICNMTLLLPYRKHTWHHHIPSLTHILTWCMCCKALLRNMQWYDMIRIELHKMKNVHYCFKGPLFYHHVVVLISHCKGIKNLMYDGWMDQPSGWYSPLPIVMSQTGGFCLYWLIHITSVVGKIETL